MATVKQDGAGDVLPAEQLVAQDRKAFDGYAENAGRLADTVESLYPGRGLVYIGAQSGEAAALSRAHPGLPILCIETSIRRADRAEFAGLGSNVEVACFQTSPVGEQVSGGPTGERGAAPLERLESVLGRHPKFQSAKILKLSTGERNERIILDALKWIAAAQPVLSWSHNFQGGAAADIFRQLFETGYRTAMIFDRRGEYIQTLSLDARQQLADLSGYFGAGEGVPEHCDLCAFHEDDTETRILVRLAEVERRRSRQARGLANGAGQPAYFRAPGEFAPEHLTIVPELRAAIANKTVELQAVRAQVEADRYRLQVQVQDQEQRVSTRDVEIQKLHVLLRDLISERAAGVAKEADFVRRGAEVEVVSAELALRLAEIADLKVLLKQAQRECAELRHALKTSVALRLARSLGWILKPIRALLVAAPPKETEG